MQNHETPLKGKYAAGVGPGRAQPGPRGLRVRDLAGRGRSACPAGRDPSALRGGRAQLEFSGGGSACSTRGPLARRVGEGSAGRASPDRGLGALRADRALVLRGGERLQVDGARRRAGLEPRQAGLERFKAGLGRFSTCLESFSTGLGARPGQRRNLADGEGQRQAEGDLSRAAGGRSPAEGRTAGSVFACSRQAHVPIPSSPTRTPGNRNWGRPGGRSCTSGSGHDGIAGVNGSSKRATRVSPRTWRGRQCQQGGPATPAGVARRCEPGRLPGEASASPGTERACPCTRRASCPRRAPARARPSASLCRKRSCRVRAAEAGCRVPSVPSCPAPTPETPRRTTRYAVSLGGGRACAHPNRRSACAGRTLERPGRRHTRPRSPRRRDTRPGCPRRSPSWEPEPAPTRSGQSTAAQARRTGPFA